MSQKFKCFQLIYLTLKGFDWKECRFVSETQIVSTFSANQQKYKKLMCFIMIQHF